jgi:hypothetical protein
MRRLPGPADCRLSEGDISPEALYELFWDWQRTQTQSSVTALWSPRQQMDVRFCEEQGPPAERHTRARMNPEVAVCAASRPRPEHLRLPLTTDLHGGRQYGHLEVQARSGPFQTSMFRVAVIQNVSGV